MSGLFPRLLGAAFADLPPAVRAMHGGGRIVATGRAVSAGRGVGALVAGVALGAPGRGRYALRFEVAPRGEAEVWTRWFGRRRLRSTLRPDPAAPGRLLERLGPAAFALRLRTTRDGFAWELEGWRLGPMPLPRWLGPKVRARCFEADGTYRFSIVVAHAWLGVVMAYAGRLAVAARELA